jgi:hypothetical protein
MEYLSRALQVTSNHLNSQKCPCGKVNLKKKKKNKKRKRKKEEWFSHPQMDKWGWPKNHP